MLLELYLTNVALIESLRLTLRPGLTTVTGETGAGKSILVDGVSLVLGGRADRTLIRTGEDFARVEALFDVQGNERAQKALDALQLSCEEGVLPLSRELTASGRSVCRACGQIVTLAQLRGLCAALVDLHGQHEHQFLLDEARHCAYLDAFGGEELLLALREVEGAFEAFTAARMALERSFSSPQERARRADMLQFQLADIDEVKPKPGEDEDLQQQRALMRSAGKIAQGVADAVRHLSQGDGRSLPATDALHSAARALEPLIALNEEFSAAHERVMDAYYAAQDAAEIVSSLQSAGVFDERALERAEERLDALQRLKRKYGATLQAVIAYRAAAQAELEELRDSEGAMERLRQEKDAAWRAMSAACTKLSALRAASASAFSAALEVELRALGMPKARVGVSVTAPEGEEARQRAATAAGVDSVAFLFTPNPGEPLKPLAKIASGGEMSRVMLALKAIGAQKNDVPTLIFDEIDVGISGHMAQVVGEKMASLAKTRQILCVTHLPQIAALGDEHLLIEKSVDGARTRTSLTSLHGHARAEALARMLGGAAESSASALEHAKAMLDAAAPLRSQAHKP